MKLFFFLLRACTFALGAAGLFALANGHYRDMFFYFTSSFITLVTVALLSADEIPD